MMYIIIYFCLYTDKNTQNEGKQNEELHHFNKSSLGQMSVKADTSQIQDAMESIEESCNLSLQKTASAALRHHGGQLHKGVTEPGTQIQISIEEDWNIISG